MLEQLFGSKTRSKLLYLFLKNPKKKFYVRELTREVGAQLNSIRREIKNLENFGMIMASEITVSPEDSKPNPSVKSASKSKAARGQKKYYVLNDDFVIYPELRSLFVKAELLVEQDLVQKILAVGRIRYLALTGVFVGLEDSSTDLFIVGQLNKKKFESLIKKFEKEMKTTINYTIMTKAEFDYRRGITDRFLYAILENQKIVAHDEIFNQAIVEAN